MKKTRLSFISTLLCALSVGLLSSCELAETPAPHEHVFSESLATADYLQSEATCTSKAVYYKSCACGEKGTETFEDGEYGAHSFAEEWTSDGGKHWRACQATDCPAVSEESVHTYTNGVCACGKTETLTDSHAVSAQQWQNAFAFENVTIKEYLVTDGQSVPVGNYLINDNDALFIIEETTIPMSGYAAAVRTRFDFSERYADAEYQNGKYYISSFDVFSDGSYLYENAYLIFENGVLLSISATITEEVVEYDDDLNEIGSTTETSVRYFEFVDYGSTNTTYDNGLPLSQAEWNEVFAEDNFDNMTIVASIPNVTETIYYANEQEKITVSSVENVALYCLDGTWYTYYTDTETFEQTDVFGEDYPFVTLSDAFKNLCSTLKDTYLLMRYDEQSNTYYWTDEHGGYTLKIENDKLTQLVQTTIVEGTTSVYTYTISDYGATAFTVPFDPAHACSFTKSVADDKYLKSPATCTSSARYYKSCQCGKAGTTTVTIGPSLGHDYGEYVSNGDGAHVRTCTRDSSHKQSQGCDSDEATCVQEGVCEVCGATYIDEHGHLVTEWTSLGEEGHEGVCEYDPQHVVTTNHFGGVATCTAKRTCMDCGVGYGTLAAHQYVSVWSSSATEHWRVCTNELCSSVSSRAEHSYTNGLCECGEVELVAISSVAELKNIDLDGNYKLACDLDLENEPWTQLGTVSKPFTGIFDGNGYTISNLTQNSISYAGLFGYNEGTIRNVVLSGVTIKIDQYLQVYPTGTAYSPSYVAGLIAYNKGTVRNCSVSGTIKVEVEYSVIQSDHGVTNSYSFAGIVTGGLIGRNSGVVENSRSEVTVTATLEVNASHYDISLCNSDIYAGGLIGLNHEIGKIANCYATKNVSATASASDYSENSHGSCAYAWAGGLVGANSGEITNCYATGNATSSASSSFEYNTQSYAGGLVGQNDTITIGADNGTISDCFATGNIQATSEHYAFAGGLVGANSSADNTTNCYRNTEQTVSATGSEASKGEIGTATSLNELTDVSFFTDTLQWNPLKWNFVDGEYPTLKA